MEPLGFARRALWLAFVADDGEVSPALVEIADVPAFPDDESRDDLAALMAQLRERGRRAVRVPARPAGPRRSGA